VVYDVIRLLTGPLRLGRHEIPAGWYVAPGIALAQRLPANYAEPAAFQPERFLENGSHGSPYQAWMPFGGGRRRCIGSQFALLEMKVVIPEVIRRVSLRALSPDPERERLKHVTLVPSRGVEVSARPLTRVPQRVGWDLEEGV
jgi:cytochrome P450